MGNLVHFYISKLLITITSVFMIPSSIHLFSSPFLFNFHLSKSLWLESYLVFHFIFLLDPIVILQFLLFILFFELLLKSGLLLLLKMEGILNLLLFLVPLLRNHIIVLAHLPFLLVLQLNVENFLYTDHHVSVLHK